MTVGQKIKEQLKEKGWTQVELAAKLGLSYNGGAISQWIKGRMKPGAENKRRLAEIFGKTAGYFEDDEEYCYNGMVMDRRDETQKNIDKLLSTFPMVRPAEVRSEISAEFFGFSLYTQPEEFLPVMFEAKPGAPFALKVGGPKACPWAAVGEYALFAPAPEGVNGKIFLVKTPQGHTIKKFFSAGGGVVLEDKNKKRKKYDAADIEVAAQLLAFYRKP